jgi:hypothetical protein
MFADITELDSGPEELSRSLPLRMRLLRPLSAPDGSDYALAELAKPIERPDRSITHIIIGARLLGSRIGRGMKDFPVNIAYVIDNSLLNDETLDFAKGEYIAIGFATERQSWDA